MHDIYMYSSPEDPARQDDGLFRPPVPEGNRTLKVALPPFNVLAFATLPGWARRMYGRPGGPLTDMAATAGLRAARLAFGQQKLFLAAMRAVHRAEWAGEQDLPSPGPPADRAPDSRSGPRLSRPKRRRSP